jgi:hypothetical protein
MKSGLMKQQTVRPVGIMNGAIARVQMVPFLGGGGLGVVQGIDIEVPVSVNVAVRGTYSTVAVQWVLGEC